uniref:Nef attachable domain protein n=1 Tax=Haemonchus placei TaxID=6290 RepID=A0A0N4VZU3_HAEPC
LALAFLSNHSWDPDRLWSGIKRQRRRPLKVLHFTSSSSFVLITK